MDVLLNIFYYGVDAAIMQLVSDCCPLRGGGELFTCTYPLKVHARPP